MNTGQKRRKNPYFLNGSNDKAVISERRRRIMGPAPPPPSMATRGRDAPSPMLIGAILLLVVLVVAWMTPTSTSAAGRIWRTQKIPPDPPLVLPSSDEPSPFAYVFLLGGCDFGNLTPFRGYLYNILIAANTLRTSGSQADIVLLIQPAQAPVTNVTASTNSTTELPTKWQHLLQTVMGVQVQYLSQQSDHQSFFSIMMQKFHVLKMTNYKRILFLDGDIVPFCNLDYLFHASMPRTAKQQQKATLLQPNFVLAGTDAPAAGNFFLLQPAAGDYEVLEQQIVRPALSREWDGNKLGWGYEIPQSDAWHRLGFGGSKFMRKYLHWGQRGTHWNFHGGPADQGLLYHWVKYVKRNVTIAIGPVVETWKDSGSGKLVDAPVLVNRSTARQHHPLHDLSCRKQLEYDYRFTSKEGTTAPYSDYEHNKKIWERDVLPETKHMTSRFEAATPVHFWFYTLRRLDAEYNIQIEWDRWLQHIGNKERPFGKGPKLADFESSSSANQGTDADTKH